MPFEPITFGVFKIDTAGRIDPVTAETQPSFSFVWRSRRVTAEIVEQRLTLRVLLGRVPSSTGQDDALRDDVFGTLLALKYSLPPAWKVRLLPDHRVEMKVDAKLILPATAATLMITLTQFLLELGPYLDLLDESGIPPVTPVAPRMAGRSGSTRASPG